MFGTCIIVNWGHIKKDQITSVDAVYITLK